MKSPLTQCLKITEKVAFNIASEASYVYILRGQKLIKKGQKLLENDKMLKITQNVAFFKKNAKIDHFLAFLINFCPLKM